MKKIFLFALLLSLTIYGKSQSALSAESIKTSAFQKAAKESKNVFVIFHASWCGWCKKMDASMNDVSTKKFFDNNYVTVHLTVQEDAAKKNLENPGAASLLEKYNGSKAGLPFFVVLDKTGNLLGDSFVNGENLGCPASENEVASFISLLKKTSKINSHGLAAITTRFRKNEAR